MPTASKELRDKWESDSKATAFLENRGFVLTREWEWSRDEAPDDEEASAIQFMIDEWDYGDYKQ